LGCEMSAAKKGRYLLYLDILGFSERVKTQSPEEIYQIIDDALHSFSRWEQLNDAFKTIYFSDTFLFYSEAEGTGKYGFLDIYAIGAMLFSALLAKGIPTRGSITFGEFIVKADSSGKHNVFFGKALIEAYEAEKKENWIGITILFSAWHPYESHNTGVVQVFESERVWKTRDDGCLLLNPFVKLKAWYSSYLIGEIDKPKLLKNSIFLAPYYADMHL